MQSTNDIRRAFLDYFAANEHAVVPSAPLVPYNDPTLMFDDPAPWHGLHLKSIDLYFGIERGPVNYSLVFDDPPERVREVWNGRGWHLPAVNDTRDVEGLEGYASIGVQADEGDFATVTCFRD